MRRALFGLIAAVLAAAPATANYYEFTGTISFSDSSKRFLPEGKSLSGSGVGFSSGAPSNEVRLSVVNGFTGTLQTAFGSTVGYTQQAFLTNVGTGKFNESSPVAGLHGKWAVGGLARRNNYASFPLTANEMTGLGLGGTLPAFKGSTPSVRFGTWTTGTVVETNVITESHPAMGSVFYGSLSVMGFDKRTSLGMGTVQFVTPIRTVGLLGVPGNRAAIGTLTLTFAPEPGRAALLIGGGTAVALLGARRASGRPLRRRALCGL